jgi:Zn-dependent protease with chaperone function
LPGLTALLIALGAVIGGPFMWVFAAVAVGANLVGYFYSDRIALRAVRAQPLTEGSRRASCVWAPRAGAVRAVHRAAFGALS